jgi:hypothetical protein
MLKNRRISDLYTPLPGFSGEIIQMPIFIGFLQIRVSPLYLTLGEPANIISFYVSPIVAL